MSTQETCAGKSPEQMRVYVEALNASDVARLEYCILLLEGVKELGRTEPLGDMWPEVVVVIGTLKRVLQPNIADAGTSRVGSVTDRSGCAAGTDEECKRIGCGSKCPAVQAQLPPAEQAAETVAKLVKKGAIMGAAYDFRDAHISGSANLKRSAHMALESAVDAALTEPSKSPV